jgi:hypothetical protein
VPLRWEPDPETVVPDPTGRTWLIIQNHGDPAYFPEDRLVTYQRAFDERLGTPRTMTRFDLPRNESWLIGEYSPACGR